MENDQEPEQQRHDFNDKQQEILKKRFKVGTNKNACVEKSLEEIIDGVIQHIACVFRDVDDEGDEKDCIRKYWFTKQIEKWKNDKKTNKDPSDTELMDIVKKDLKIRIANTMLELKKRKCINDKNDIWFYQDDEDTAYVVLLNNNNKICNVSKFNTMYHHISPPYEPFFMDDPNGEGKLNGVCICKHGYINTVCKTKWITACFNDDSTYPQYKIIFQTNKDDKITNVGIEKSENISSKTTYTISLNGSGEVGQITKNDEDDKNKDYKDEIKQLLFGDETNKVLIKKIEDELDSQQKNVFDAIKKHIVIEENKKENKKNEKIKNEEQTASIKNNTTNTSFDNNNSLKNWFKTTPPFRECYNFCCGEDNEVDSNQIVIGGN